MLKPFMVQKTIMFIQDPQSKENGYAMVAALVASEIIQYMLGQHQHFMNCNTGWKVSKVLTQMVFSKQLRHTPSTKQNFGTGEILHMIHSDTTKLIGFTWELATFLMLPVKIIYCSYFLAQLLGLSFLAGIAVFATGSVFSSQVMKKIQEARKNESKLGEERINITNESISNMKTLKFYQLTDIFKSQIEEKNLAEQNHDDKMRYMHYMMGAIMTIFPSSMSNASFYMNVKLGRVIDLPTALTILMLFDTIRHPLGHFPWLWTEITDIKKSMKRLQKYFDSPELNIDNFLSVNECSDLSIEIKKSDFTWGMKVPKEEEDEKKDEEKKMEEKSEPKKVSYDSYVTLKEIELQVKKGEFVCIIGDVGSGKSSILSTIIGDLIPIN